MDTSLQALDTISHSGNVDISPDSALSSRQKKSKKRFVEVKSFSLDEPLQGDGREKTGRAGSLVRSKTYDASSSLRPSDDPTVDRRRSITSNLPKHNLAFHKIFRDVPEDEELKDSFTCALQREVLYQGRLYISHNYLGFYCNMLRKEIKVLIPVSTVILVKKANTALLVPNALSVRTIQGDKYLFGSLRNREICYHAVRDVCTNLQNSSHSDFEQAHQESDGAENCISEVAALLQVQNRMRSIPSEVDGQAHGNFINGDVCQEKTSNTNQTRWADASTVNVLLLIYMLLVLLLLLSSGYIGLRIMELENQLSIMGAWPAGGETH
ncbi:GRAM domain-containing protein 2B-like isoform X3 [Pseudophryne corroboree]|uniref:GRAM domain-containing protein 2B-like isoform X3 n=1 Tax=Pseudophryne corroboree TaxID=495146 RepID=UPI0030812B22